MNKYEEKTSKNGGNDEKSRKVTNQNVRRKDTTVNLEIL